MTHAVANILVVEDHFDSARPIIVALEKAGHHVTHAPDGDSALAHLRHDQRDLVVLDLLMPETDGFDVLKVMRSYLRWHNVPVIVVSAAADSDIALAKQLGAQLVFRKGSFALKDLLSSVKQMLDDDAATRPN